jgi:formate-dependent nitrite reductase membrane component NrfD
MTVGRIGLKEAEHTRAGDPRLPFFLSFWFFFGIFLFLFCFFFVFHHQTSLNYGTSAREVQVGAAPKGGQWLKALWCCSGLNCTV